MSSSVSTGIAITNPLVLYRALVATKQITPDPAQHRLALHLQKLYDRLKDYEPALEYGQRLKQISRAIGTVQDGADPDEANPKPRSTWQSLLAQKEKRDTLALTRNFTSRESALLMDSPKGMMLHGEVGTGKSMLVDLFADCLPNRKKRRWHFNTFMLETFAKLEGLRRTRMVTRGTEDEDSSLLWLAKDMIQTSPILFLDEFQLPDRASSKIMTNLMTSFFHLGGVLIATSNRMPEELAKAAGIEIPPPPTRMESLSWQFGLRRRSSSASDRLFGGRSEFAGFLEVLRARCEVWEMEGAKDYRRIDSGSRTPSFQSESLDDWQLDDHQDMQHAKGMAGWQGEAVEKGDPIALQLASDESAETAKIPNSYLLKPEATALDEGEDFVETLRTAQMAAAGISPSSEAQIPWQLATIKVYGRTIPIPRTYNGVASWTFAELCNATLGPADYISLASSYHTFVLTEVPVLTWLMKNEARRFITLLDALYECRCKLLISASAGPDDIFKLDQKARKSENDGGDAVYPETLSEVYQDATAPFRPNILSQNPNYSEPDAEPDYTHARLAGLLSADALEDDPPNRPRGSSNPFGRSFGRTDSEMERGPIDPDEPRRAGPNFAETSAFTGEDERFAYKRAQSRLWEMCGVRWWARNEPGWHRPLPAEVRRWEKAAEGEDSISMNSATRSIATRVDAAMGEATIDESRPESMFRHNASPFRTAEEPPPKISWSHIWGTGIKWGKKAGAWGRGVEGLKDRGDQKR